jgi:uncharacterized membrane protein YgaE (UPF0421/DUF939 family)
MRMMINQLLGRFGLRLVKESEFTTDILTKQVMELRERNRELAKRMARHVASAHYYKKNYLRLRGKEDPA